MASPLPKTGLPLRITAMPHKGTGKTTDLEILIEAEGKDLTVQAERRNLQQQALALHRHLQQGRQVDRRRTPGCRSESSARDPRARRPGRSARDFAACRCRPGRYQLRVAAQDNAKTKQGSAHFDIDVPDFSKAPLAMSGVALASTADRSVASGTDLTMGGGLPGAPSTLREFPAGSEIAAYVEVYDNQPTPTHRLDISTTVRADDGRVVFTNSTERSSEELKGAPGAFGYSVRIPMTAWAPGLHVLTIEAKSRLSNTAAVSRVIQFQVK